MFTVRVDVSDTATILRNHGLNPEGRVQAFFTSEIMRKADPYVPYSAGALRESARVSEDKCAIIYKEHCTCYDELIRNKVVAIMLVPDSGYKLRYTDNENIYDVSGFVLINANAIDSFDCYSAVEEGTETPTEADEISDAEALAIITGGNDNDESGS